MRCWSSYLDAEQGQVILFCRERDPDMELWNGYRLGPEGAIAYSGAR